jgi:hypothetical protein
MVGEPRVPYLACVIVPVSFLPGGFISGVGNTYASLAAYAMPLWVAKLVSHGSWPAVFWCIAQVNVLAAGLFAVFSSAQPVDVNVTAKQAEMQLPLLVQVRPQ